MKTKLILKGVLLYSTFLLAMLYVAGIDSIMDKGFDTFLFITGLVAGLIYLCYKKISEKEADILLFTKYFGMEEKEDFYE